MSYGHLCKATRNNESHRYALFGIGQWQHIQHHMLAFWSADASKWDVQKDFFTLVHFRDNTHRREVLSSIKRELTRSRWLLWRMNEINKDTIRLSHLARIAPELDAFIAHAAKQKALTKATIAELETLRGIITTCLRLHSPLLILR